MKSQWLQFFKHGLAQEPVLHPLDRGIAKRYIKQRLAAIYPQLRGDPGALEQAYQTLNLEPRAGDGPEEAATVFEMTLPA